MKYTCELCVYSTTRKSSFKTHCLSKKHKLIAKKDEVSPILKNNTLIQPS